LDSTSAKVNATDTDLEKPPSTFRQLIMSAESSWLCNRLAAAVPLIRVHAAISQHIAGEEWLGRRRKNFQMVTNEKVRRRVQLVARRQPSRTSSYRETAFLQFWYSPCCRFSHGMKSIRGTGDIDRFENWTESMGLTVTVQSWIPECCGTCFSPSDER
jgi:hypothetical protein